MTEDPGPARADTSDWTWVLARPCPQCGFAAAAVGATDLPFVVTDAGQRFAAVLDRADVRRRPDPEVWSPLEYVCHVRDVCHVMTGRVEQILAGGGATVQFSSWGQNAASVAEQYWRTDVAGLRAEVSSAFDEAATAFSRPRPEQWGWEGVRGDGARFTALSLGRYLAHELHHHLWDVSG